MHIYIYIYIYIYSIKLLQTLLHVSMLLHRLQGALILRLLKLLNIKIIYSSGSLYGKISVVEKMC